jgi:hypothetical protein
MLMPLLLLLVGVRGEALDARWLTAGVVGCIGVTAAFLASVPFGDSVLVIGMAAWIWRRDRVSPRAIVSLAMVATLLLPAVLFLWPFHFRLITLSLTPIAAALVALAGGRWVMARMCVTVTTEPTTNAWPASP